MVPIIQALTEKISQNVVSPNIQESCNKCDRE
jgi:hypothetical protein